MAHAPSVVPWMQKVSFWTSGAAAVTQPSRRPGARNLAKLSSRTYEQNSDVYQNDSVRTLAYTAHSASSWLVEYRLALVGSNEQAQDGNHIDRQAVQRIIMIR